MFPFYIVMYSRENKWKIIINDSVTAPNSCPLQYIITGTLVYRKTHVHLWCLHVDMSLWSVQGNPTEALWPVSVSTATIYRPLRQKNPVAVHFAQAGHSISSMRYIGIEMVQMSCRGGDIERKLLQRESLSTGSTHCLRLVLMRSLTWSRFYSSKILFFTII
jgi:hypothetical protein